VDRELHVRVVASAAVSGRNVSEEFVWYAQQGIAWEAARPEIEAWMAEVRRRANVKLPIEQALRELGLDLTKVSVVDATVPNELKLTVTDPDLARERIAALAAIRAIEKVRK
jgi:hypothetical protein